MTKRALLQALAVLPMGSVTNEGARPSVAAEQPLWLQRLTWRLKGGRIVPIENGYKYVPPMPCGRGMRIWFAVSCGPGDA